MIYSSPAVDKLSTVDCLETDKSQDSSVFLKKLCKQAMDAISLVYVLSLAAGW